MKVVHQSRLEHSILHLLTVYFGSTFNFSPSLCPGLENYHLLTVWSFSKFLHPPPHIFLTVSVVLGKTQLLEGSSIDVQNF